MPKIASVLSVLNVLVLFAGSPTRAQTVRVEFDTRAEVIGILFRIAGASDFRNGLVQPYITEVDSAFTPFKDHAVFAEINRLRRQSGLSLSSVVTMAPQISDPITFRERAPIDAPTSTLSGAWRGADARPFLAAASDFARVAHLDAFLRARQPLYDSAAIRLRRAVNESADLTWLGRYFGGSRRDTYIVSPMLINSTGNFGSEFGDGATRERYAFTGIGSTDSRGFPVIGPDAIGLVIHELSHSFVNPVVGSRSELQQAGEQIYRAVQASMQGLAYNGWQTMLNESVVRATVIRHMRAHNRRLDAEHETQLQQGRGFVWMGELVALFDEYEADRSRYPTLTTFMPRLTRYVTDLAPRIDSMIAAFERERPRIVNSSIPNNAASVDPRLTRIVFHFDKPVDPTIQLVGNHGGGTPELTSATFDSTHTTLTLGVKLEAGRDYFLPLGPGAFVGRNGYPLVELQLRFRTAGQR